MNSFDNAEDQKLATLALATLKRTGAPQAAARRLGVVQGRRARQQERHRHEVRRRHDPPKARGGVGLHLRGLGQRNP